MKKNVRFERELFYEENIWFIWKSRTKGFEKERQVKSHESFFESRRVGSKMDESY